MSSTAALVLPTAVLIAGRSVQILYAGSAPGNVSGFTQMNALIPPGLQFGGNLPLKVEIGGISSQLGVTLSVSGPPAPLPGAPASLSTSLSSSNQLVLMWTAADSLATRFHLERQVDGADRFAEIADLPATSATFTDSDAAAGYAYHYRLRAESDYGLSGYSSVVTGTAPGAALPPAPVLQAVAASSTQIHLTWTAAATPITHFRIERKTNTAPYAEIAQPDASSTSFDDSGLSPSTAYLYRMRAETTAGLSPYSGEVMAATLAPYPTAIVTQLDAEISALISQVDRTRISSSIQKLASFQSRNSCSDNASGSSTIGGARGWIQSQFAGIPGLEVTSQPFAMTGCSSRQSPQNVIAWIPTRVHPERLIVLSGHYDSRTISGFDGGSAAPGANDSGSQTALLIEAARLLSGHSFDATIVFASFAGEEQGLIGSRFFVTNFNTIFPGARLELNLNSDIVGGDNTTNDAAGLQHFRLFSPGTPREISSGEGTTDDTSPSRGLMRYVGTWGGYYVPDLMMTPVLREDRPWRGGDHESFIASAVPGVRFIEVSENLAHQHTGQDLFSFVTPDYTARVAKTVASVAASLARAPTAPQSLAVQSITGGAVTLDWQPPANGPAVDHYVIAARSTSENFYRARVAVSGTSTSGRVRIQGDLGIGPGDSFFVSVAAVDASGHESLFAYPEFRCSVTSCSIPPEALNVTASK